MAPVMAKGKTEKAKPKVEKPKERILPTNIVKKFLGDPRGLKTRKAPSGKGTQLLRIPGTKKVKIQASEGGAPNEYLVDFLSLISQLPTKDYDVIRKLVGRWKQSKVLVKEFLQDAVKEAGIDPEYAQKVAEDFKIAAPVMDKLEVLYDKFGDAMGEMDKIKTHFEPLQDLVQKIQSKSEQEQAPAEPSPTDEPAMAPEDNTEEPVTTEK
jgi:hypothetical protein